MSKKRGEFELIAIGFLEKIFKELDYTITGKEFKTPVHKMAMII